MSRTISTIEPNVTLRSPGKPAAAYTPDPEAYALETSIRSMISLGTLTAPRSQQTTIGMSEIGNPCERRIAYRLAGTAASHLSDPLRALVGSGVHQVLAELFRRLDARSGRFLVEHHVTYRGIPGTVDLFDRLTGTVIDWKTTLRSKLSQLKANGPQSSYMTQIHGYGAGLRAIGEAVSRVALIYVPVDSTLTDVWGWQTIADPGIADVAIDRVDRIRTMSLTSNSGHVDPATMEPSPSALCCWCPFYRPGSTNLSHACPGNS